MLQQIDTVTPLTSREAEELQRCEAIIERGLDTFYEVGTALLTIRDQRLYRATPTNPSFARLLHWSRKNSGSYGVKLSPNPTASSLPPPRFGRLSMSMSAR